MPTAALAAPYHWRRPTGSSPWFRRDAHRGSGSRGPSADRPESRCDAPARDRARRDVASTPPRIVRAACQRELIAEALYPYPRGTRHRDPRAGFDRSGRDEWRRTRVRIALRGPSMGACAGCAVDRIDLYQLHRIDPPCRERDQFGFLQRMRAAAGENQAYRLVRGERRTNRARARRFFPSRRLQD